METKYKIGYIDEDDKQVKKYRKRFRDFGIDIIGYEFQQGMSIEGLMEQVYQSEIDLLMIDYKLDESNKVQFNGEEVEKEIYNNKPLFPHIIFTNKREDAEDFVDDWKIIFNKAEITNKHEEDYDEDRTKHFIKTLIKSIEQYKKRIESRKNSIAELLIKGEKEGLNSSEQDSLISLQRELGDLDKTKKKEVPEKLISFEKLDDLSKTRKEAEAFLRSLIQKNKK
ncbi:hypothetical protein [uncultured Polaribacter sp.]|uniref:hypothetical protein n=1 Tax=uncultured Polaribacter sp. TaxID=174711 RepID=UPI0030D8210C|tara:strand:- start:2607 stop:3281 length:675 start_codon:yes stop_codon:yes gene_type:complete